MFRNQLWQRVRRVPKRRWKTAVVPLLQAMNDAFAMIMCIEEDPVRGTKTAAKTRYHRIVEAQRRIMEMEKPLWVFWNIAGDPNEYRMKYWKPKQRANLCAEVNEKVLAQLYDMQKKSSAYEPELDKGLMCLRYYTEEEIDKAQFLQTLREFHRMTHGKVLRLNATIRDADGSLLLRFADIAWYYAVHGNQLKLNVPEERAERKKEFSVAISALYKAQRPLFNLFSIGDYSNREMKEWTSLLNDATRLLLAVQNSDNRRTE